MTTKLKIVSVLAPTLILLDQATKLWTVRALRYSGPALPSRNPLSLTAPWDGLRDLGHSNGNPAELPVIPGFLSLIHAQNPGAAMGLFNRSDYRLLVFYAFTLGAVYVLTRMYKQLPDGDRWQSATVALILAGAVGNFIDRLHKSTVTDFVRVYTENPTLADILIKSPLHAAEWPTFNVADAAIVVGVAMYLAHYLFVELPAERAARKSAI